MTAPVGEVTTPMTEGRKGSDLLAALFEEPFGGEPLLAVLEQRHQRADAGGLQRLDDDLVLRLSGEGADLPGHHHLESLLGLDLEVAAASSSTPPPTGPSDRP